MEKSLKTRIHFLELMPHKYINQSNVANFNPKTKCVYIYIHVCDETHTLEKDHMSFLTIEGIMPLKH